VNNTLDVGGWQTIAPSKSGFEPRTGHGGVFMPDQCLYVFGGNTLNTFLDDLVRFCLHKNRWETINKRGTWPSGRHGHAIARYQEGFYMYGGIVDSQVHSEQLWWFDTVSLTWHFIETTSQIQPPRLASHSLTAVEDKWLYLFGGQMVDKEFTSDIFRIDIANPVQWEKVNVVGGKESTRRLSGHSTVYHSPSKSLLIFGGFTPSYARFPKRTNLLHSFHIEQNQWNQINYGFADSMEPPLERAFHSASIIGNYMIIVGGNAHIHHRAELCFDGDVYYYHLGCHRWILRETLETPFKGKL
jgi:N-acetylneuraminic acid mutarotase